MGSWTTGWDIASNPASIIGPAASAATSIAAPLIGQSNTPTAPVTIIRDDFHRPNTAAGQLGSSPRCSPARLTGAGFASAQVTNNQFVGTGGVIYCFERFRATPSLLKAAVAWVPGPGASTADSTVALISSVNNGLITDMIHCLFNQHTLTLQKRAASGAFVTVAGPTNIVTPAVSDGTIYPISVAINGATVTMTGPDGTQISATDADFALLPGKWNTWELTNDGSAKAEARFAMRGATVPMQWSPRAFREVILADSPLCYWPMDDIDSTNVANGSFPMDNAGANLYYGSLQNPADITIGAPGLVVGDLSTAFLFGGAGTGIVNCGNAVAQQLTTGTMVILVNSTDTRSGDHALFGKYNAWVLEMVSGTLKFRDFTGGLRDTGVFIADGENHLVVASFVSGGAGQTLVYVDGRLVLTTTSTVVNQATGIAIMGATGTWQAKGTAQHAALWGSVLTPAQVLAYWNAAQGVS